MCVCVYIYSERHRRSRNYIATVRAKIYTALGCNFSAAAAAGPPDALTLKGLKLNFTDSSSSRLYIPYIRVMTR